jgi:CTP synthase
MVIEYGRSVLKLTDANSTEMDAKATDKVIDLMEEQKHITNMGASMRLGAYDCVLKKGSLAFKAYGKAKIEERHRHRFEFNNQYKDQYEAAGMKCTGINPDSDLVEVVEVPHLRWYLGTQFHPEYNSTVISPNPLFLSFMKAAANTREEKRK